MLLGEAGWGYREMGGGWWKSGEEVRVMAQAGFGGGFGNDEDCRGMAVVKEGGWQGGWQGGGVMEGGWQGG